MIRTACFLAASTLLVVSAASAETYWLRYEGDDFPENCGWTRIWNEPFAERWIEDGALVIDATADRHTCEWYEFYTDNVLWPVAPVEVPQPGSPFFMQWRLKIEDFVGGWIATSVALYCRDSWAVAFFINDDTIRSAFESDVSATFEPGIFHEFEMRSPDMRAYELYIDGSLAFDGSFYDSISSSRISWGEGVTGASSLSRWDYFRVGIAPEPSCAVAAVVLLAATLTARRRRL